MDKILVHGGASLSGSVKISGSKNSALPILAATLLTKEPCVIHHVPDLSDIHYMLQILSHLGAQVERASGVVTVQAENIRTEAPYEIVRKMRASVCVLGPLLGREKEATVSLPGGCVIGDRPIDLHLKGFEALGAMHRIENGNVKVFAGELKGSSMHLRGKLGPTVLGTDNVMMAAVLAEGVTVIDSAAAEPEVEDLANFLIKMGAKIEGAGTRRIVIEGVKELHGAEHSVIPDRIEAGTFLVAGAIAGKGITLKRVDPAHLSSVTEALSRAGFVLKTDGDTVTISPNGAPKPLELTTEPYPGFPTDMQAQMCALLAKTPGISVITETIFPQRYMHVSEMKRMGADISLNGPMAIIKGVERLSGAPVMASDLRASAALVLAGLHSEGVTEVNRVYHIDRGYELIDEKLNGLGAHIERVKA
ncbi:UDP-N-acetylglucosamine 1-carboxyvinyltransferase [Chthoniobacter flavus Ellin428]|uniref:UDP-N-acetylglucosamine 1-carboxyvinyltransferase n=1 Tax=Chthoniobacter flavus Ellin428 TaxID=497964 RepID=B4CY65_9BACT|nr:UDP-N-acetylglucosamine 1-carboxyvinyltransferase [Chthoniobacter flavus]EDY21213.1 UDP-N-acetylglucosamine 1-carboxyvinyltransferase [Chthoniobacter flavus Ellin428]TCO87582.1 UDP-N-acetylglucosamine 1-carboxyvinyltransferase [Chthoniobacter flavus]